MEELYRRHASVVLAYLRGLTRDQHQAEDLMQETFVRATRALGGYRGGSPRAWLLAIARTTFLDAVRRRTETPVSELPDEGTRDPDVVERLTVQRVLARLSEPHRTVLVLRDELGLPYADIADAIGRSLGATKVLIHRARKAFRATYELEAGHD
ncbi:MAG: RNA polymerase sigma factor [Nitriliruptoraceae bacterium]|nr:RNA polymerase sigma factor [Nitriliruptoraceae bacterium]